MKRYILLFWLILISVISYCQTPAEKVKLSEDNGLVNAKLGSPISNIKNLKSFSSILIPLGPIEPLVIPLQPEGLIRYRVSSVAQMGRFYFSKKDKQRFAGVKIKKITYFFLDDTLTTITIKFKSKNQVISAIENLSVQYGKPDSVFKGFYSSGVETDLEEQNQYLDNQKAQWTFKGFSLYAIPSTKKVIFHKYIHLKYYKEASRRRIPTCSNELNYYNRNSER